MGITDGRCRWLATALVSVLLLVATACSKSSDISTSATTIFVQHFTYKGVPETLPSGINEFLFQNKESFTITHEIIPIALGGKDRTGRDRRREGERRTDEDDWLHIGGDLGAVDTGAGIVEWLNLPPGNYAFACWQTGTQIGGEDGPPTHPSRWCLSGVHGHLNGGRPRSTRHVLSYRGFLPWGSCGPPRSCRVRAERYLADKPRRRTPSTRSSCRSPPSWSSASRRCSCGGSSGIAKREESPLGNRSEVSVPSTSSS